MKVKILVNVFLLFLLVFTGCQKSVISKPPPVVIPPDAKIVCIFFDDAYKNQYDEAYPILRKYNFKATFGVITGHIGLGGGIYEYMSAGDLEDLARNGMDIGSHTVHHLDLTTLSDDDMRAEIFNSKKDLESMGFVVDTFIPPYLGWNDKVVEYVIAANYTCSRAGWTHDETFNPSNPDPKARYHIASWQITTENLSAFKAIVDRAGPNAVVCLVYHFISDDGPAGTSTPVANFQIEMAYLKDAGFTVVSLPDLFRQ